MQAWGINNTEGGSIREKVNQVIKLTVYTTREALSTHMDLLQPENGFTGKVSGPADFTGL